MVPSILLLTVLLACSVSSDGAFYSIDAPSPLSRSDQSPPRDSNPLRKFECDFGTDQQINLCSWTSSESSSVKWRAGQGAHAHWSGGPSVDNTFGNSSGGFAYLETSFRSPSSASPSERAFDFKPLQSLKSVISLTREITKKAEPLLEARIQPFLYKFNSIREKVENRLQGTRIINNVQNIYTNLRDTPSKASLISPVMPATRPSGVCIKFYYAVAGLSAEKMTLTIAEKSSSHSRVLWQTKFDSQEEWMQMETLYAHPSDHQLIIDGYAKNGSSVEREYRGYIAVDDISFSPKTGNDLACHGHCTFDGGFCDWYNLEHTDDTDWKLGKGSLSLDTGPSQDFNSFAKDVPPGNFIFIDSDMPRRYLDRAILVSPDFQATTSVMGYCLKFAYHMYGDGIGSLRVTMQTKQYGDEVLWSVSGEQGNRWLLAQVPIDSRYPFKLLLEATVGATPRGNIALDAVSFSQQFCSTNPSSASSRIGDCSFEESLCNWLNRQVDDDFDWVRVQMSPSTGLANRNVDSSPDNKMNSSITSNSYYLTLNGDRLRPNKAGLSAQVTSPVFAPNTIQCITFQYLMHQDVSRTRDHKSPTLGGLRVLITWTDKFNETNSKLIWKLNNHQSNKWRQARIPLGMHNQFDRQYKAPDHEYRVVIEGIWSNLENGHIGIDEISFATGDCKMVPDYARVELGECSFDRDTCGWVDFTINNTHNMNTVWTPFKLVAASTASDSALFLRDHTFNNLVGYMASTSIYNGMIHKSILISPILSSRFDPVDHNSTERCLGFWFSSFPGKENLPSSKSLSVFQAVLLPRLGIVDGKSFLLWKLSGQSFQDDRWNYGQVSFPNELRYRILFKTEALDGGFAIDDITFYDGPCQTRPFTAGVNDTHVQF